MDWIRVKKEKDRTKRSFFCNILVFYFIYLNIYIIINIIIWLLFSVMII